MSTLIENLSRKAENFSVDIPTPAGCNLLDLISDELSLNPAITASIESCSLSWSEYGSFSRVDFSVSYYKTKPRQKQKQPVFLVRNLEDFLTAFSLGLRLHLTDLQVVCDNKVGVFPCDMERFGFLRERAREFTGEELELGQASGGQWILKNFFERNRTLFFHESCFYFDSWKEINDLQCIIASDALQIRKECGNNTLSMLASILYYLRENFSYLNTNRTADHSAVGMYKNGTGVCQAIAVYAYIFCQYLGIKARYVCGEANGSDEPDNWEAHAWNQVFFNNRWIHIDYTWQLSSGKPFEIVPESVLREDHRWDEEQYSQINSTEVVNSKNRLRHSKISCYPTQPVYAVNECIVDTSNTHPMSIVNNGQVYVAIFDVVSIFGGCYVLQRDQILTYLGTNSYSYPLQNMIFLENSWYLPAIQFGRLGLQVSVESNIVVIKNRND